MVRLMALRINSMTAAIATHVAGKQIIAIQTLSIGVISSSIGPRHAPCRFARAGHRVRGFSGSYVPVFAYIGPISGVALAPAWSPKRPPFKSQPAQTRQLFCASSLAIAISRTRCEYTMTRAVALICSSKRTISACASGRVSGMPV